MESQTGEHKTGFPVIPGYTGIAGDVRFSCRKDKKTVHDKISSMLA
jgi:hypothetical protein